MSSATEKFVAYIASSRSQEGLIDIRFATYGDLTDATIDSIIEENGLIDEAISNGNCKPFPEDF